jgi:WS/DGAT/MGAT family acyltransferase
MGTSIPMLDLMFFLTETSENPRHVGALLVFERPKATRTDFVGRVVESFRRAVPVAPFNRVPVFRKAGLPEWHEAGALDMDWHVQRLALPAPGSEPRLHELVAKLHEPMLERDRPGWRIFVIDGLERDRFAVFIKVHHALVDGESGMELLQRSLSHSPRDRRIRSIVATSLTAPRERTSASQTSEREDELSVFARKAVAIGLGAFRLAEETFAGFRGPSQGEARSFAAPLTPMNEPICSERSISHVMLPLDAMKAVARTWGATLNDVALCVLDAAMNRYLRGMGKVPSRPLVAICPVSLQQRDARQASTQVSMFWTPLGAPAATLAQRMRAVMTNTVEAKRRIRSLPRDAAYAYSVLSFAMGETLAHVPRHPQDFLLASNVLVSNVRGPDEPLYLGGARLEALCPVSTLISGMGLNITFMSYAGQVLVGFTANASALPGMERLARYTQDAFAALIRQGGPAERDGSPRPTRPVASRSTKKGARADAPARRPGQARKKARIHG